MNTSAMMTNSSYMSASMMSDSFSVISSSGGGGGQLDAGNAGVGGIMVEEVGSLIFGDIVPKKMVLFNYTLAMLSDDGRLLLGEIRSRGGDDWVIAGRSLINLNDQEKRYLDVALVPNIQQGSGGVSIIFLTEKVKNKERCLTAHHIRHGKTLELKDEFSSYDKVNVLGKGVSHIGSTNDPSEPPTVYAVSSNLVRKLRLEDAGTNLKPTTARAQVPADCQDGTLSICIQQLPHKKASITGSPFGSNQVNVIVAFKTKSAGRNKYTVEYYNSKSKGDEIFNTKTSVKLGEESEPTVLLTDPKDPRNVYALCVNKTNGTTALHKIHKGRQKDEPLRIFNYEIRSAAMSFSADKSVILVTYDAIGDIGRIYTLQKTEGFRGKHPLCPQCPSLDVLQSPSHIISCSSTRWQLSGDQVEHVIGMNRPLMQIALTTLVDQNGKYVTEPESESPYRLRIIGCDTQNMHPEAILVEDLERSFDGEEHRLANSVLKICLGHSPCRECQSKMSAFLMSGRIGVIELYYVKPLGFHDENLDSGASERFILRPITADKFRTLVSDIDWTQMTGSSNASIMTSSTNSGRQGTFTLEDQEAKQRPQSALTRGTSPRSSGGAGGGHGSRIPTPRASVERTPSGRLSSISSSMYGSGSGDDNHQAASANHHHHEVESEKVLKLKAVIKKLSNTLNAVLDADASMRSNLHSLREDLEEAMAQTNGLHLTPEAS